MNKHRIGALVAAAALTLTFAGTAFANDLHQETPITGTEFKSTEVGCSEGWHFVHTETSSANLPSQLTVEFENAGIKVVDGYVNGNSIVMYDVHVDPDDTLLSASDSITNGGLLNLSHVCVDQTTTTTTTQATTTQATTTQATTTQATTTTTTDSINTETTDTSTTTTTTSKETTSHETTSEETTPEGSVEELTPPHTDTIGQPASSSSVSTGMLLVLAGILSIVLVAVPAAVRNRR